MAHNDIVETTPAAVEHIDTIPLGRVVFVTAAGSESRIDTLALRHCFPFGGQVVILHVKGDGTLAIVGIQVDGDLPGVPMAIRSDGFEVASHRVAGQHHTVHEEGVVRATCHHHVDTTIGEGAVLIGIDRFADGVRRRGLTQRRKNRAVAVAVIADADEIAPPLAQDVAFKLDDTAV